MPTVSQIGWTNKHVSVACPLCSDGTRILRDATAWQVHMESEHSADDMSWSDTKERGCCQGVRDLFGTHVKYGYKCYGCGASFRTEAELTTHLSDVHSAS